MELNQPKLKPRLIKVEFSEEFDYLSPGDETTYISAILKIGGFYNSGYQTALEELEFKSRVAMAEISHHEKDDVAIRMAAEQHHREEFGTELLGLIYDHCLEAWETNIESSGTIIEPTRETFLALGQQSLPPLVDFFIRVDKSARDMKKFVELAEADQVKN